LRTGRFTEKAAVIQQMMIKLEIRQGEQKKLDSIINEKWKLLFRWLDLQTKFLSLQCNLILVIVNNLIKLFVTNYLKKI